MFRFIKLTLALVLILGVAIHAKIEIPYLNEWIGKLPGDLQITRQGVTLFFPFTTASIMGLALSWISYLFSKK